MAPKRLGKTPQRQQEAADRELLRLYMETDYRRWDELPPLPDRLIALAPSVILPPSQDPQ